MASEVSLIKITVKRAKCHFVFAKITPDHVAKATRTAIWCDSEYLD